MTPRVRLAVALAMTKHDWISQQLDLSKLTDPDDWLSGRAPRGRLVRDPAILRVKR